MNAGETSEFDSFDEFEQRRIKNIISGIKKSSSFSGNPFEKAITIYVDELEGDYSQLSLGMLKAYRKYGKLSDDELKEVNGWIDKRSG